MPLHKETTGLDVTGPEVIERTTGRRGFLKVAVGCLAALSAFLLGMPFLKALITPPAPHKTRFTKVGDLASIPAGRPTDIKFETTVQDAFYSKRVLRMAWVIKHDDGSVTVFSPVCTHLGCHFNWNPKSAEFECPCHASTFAIDGKVLGGPAPRPLDTLPYKIKDNALYVRWVDYEPGTSVQKVV